MAASPLARAPALVSHVNAYDGVRTEGGGGGGGVGGSRVGF